MIYSIFQFLRCKYFHLATNVMSSNAELQQDVYKQLWRTRVSYLQPTTVRGSQ